MDRQAEALRRRRLAAHTARLTPRGLLPCGCREVAYTAAFAQPDGFRKQRQSTWVALALLVRRGCEEHGGDF